MMNLNQPPGCSATRPNNKETAMAYDDDESKALACVLCPSIAQVSR